jgi:subtilisin family serine protease
VGVARFANVVAVKVLDCGGSGSISNTLAGLDWVASNMQKPAVVSLSLGVPEGRFSQAIVDAVSDLISNRGITVVTAAGDVAMHGAGEAWD